MPLSVGMFPHLFQHWLTARSAKTLPADGDRPPDLHHDRLGALRPDRACGPRPLRRTAKAPPAPTPTRCSPNGRRPGPLSRCSPACSPPAILAAIMSSLDSQFMCLGTMFTNDIVVHACREGPVQRRPEDPDRPRLHRGDRRHHLRALACCEHRQRLRPRGVVLQRLCEPVPAGPRRASTGGGVTGRARSPRVLVTAVVWCGSVLPDIIARSGQDRRPCSSPRHDARRAHHRRLGSDAGRRLARHPETLGENIGILAER